MLPSLNLDLVRTFLAVVDAGGLTRAGERLRLSQPTISLQIKRLEDTLGCRLIERSPRSFRLTSDGEVLATHGRRIIMLSDELVARMIEPAVSGLVRLGTPEDFATAHLSGVLAAFATAHPNVALEVTTDLTLNLIERFGAGEFDLVLIKREPLGPSEGVRVWHEALVWACAPQRVPVFADTEHDLPLVVSPHPCVYRKRAMRALDRLGRRWRVAYTSTSLAGAQAAVRAGLGVTVLPKDMVPADFSVLEGPSMPDLSATEIALMAASTLSVPAAKLAEHIVHSLERGA
ncbi:LysR family transcriptional regulator [Methylobacterium durans]|uniref:LysR family transcriptional regulator n=1 Tax=Methylobacterium durans TaxID=2202825 RepID=A0A2U8W3X6_9HYPH|nr:LysR family transcriptional regulator [Methylobacterium durans]AWN40757.1 LysR family transcriptional regulator [Methylobacterium durans]